MVSVQGRRRTTTFHPDSDLTDRQKRRQAEEFARKFENECNNMGVDVSPNIKLSEFFDVYRRNYGQNLKPKTLRNYQECFRTINAALGHIKLRDLKRVHIDSFFRNLQESGLRLATSYSPNEDFDKVICSLGHSNRTFAAAAGVSVSAVRRIRHGQNISRSSAENIANSLGLSFQKAFLPVADDSPLSASTIKTHHRALSAVLSQAVKWEYIDKNPAKNARLPAPKRSKRYLDEDEIRAFLTALQTAPLKWQALIIVALLGGLRRAELCGLRWVDVDIQNQCIHVRQTSNYIPGVGIYTGTPKTEESERSIKVPMLVFNILNLHKREQEAEEERLGDAWDNEDGRVFTTSFGRPISPDTVSHWVPKFCRENGIKEVNLHGLRHTYASLLIANGVPTVAVASQLGHASPSTTRNIYAHVFVSSKNQAVEVLEHLDAEVDFSRSAEQRIRKIYG